jgi:hypothetical protein
MSYSKQAERYLHPFHESAYDPEHGITPPGIYHPKPLYELRMCRLSAHIRQKPNWWVKIHDETIRSKWIQEAKEQQAGRPHWEQLTDNMVSQGSLSNSPFIKYTPVEICDE